MEDKIAKIIYSDLHNSEFYPWECLQPQDKDVFIKIARQIIAEIKQDLLDMVEIDPHLLEGLIGLRKIWQLDQAEKGLFRVENSDEDLVHIIICAKSRILKLKGGK